MSSSSILDEAIALQGSIVELRRQLHSQPELSFQETRTSAKLAEELRALGFSVTTAVAGTGVVADLGEGPRTIAIRAEMDGLPLLENNSLPFKSQIPGVMHACGHDAHCACAIAAARILAGKKLPGRLRMIMQPAEEDCDEEGWSGGKRMVDAGVLSDADAVIGMHVSSSLPAGVVAIPAGPIFAAADTFNVSISPERARHKSSATDAILIAAHIIDRLQQVVSRTVPATQPVVITVGSLHSKESSVEIEGTVRTFDEQVRQNVLQQIDALPGVAAALHGKAVISYNHGYPATINNDTIAAIMRSVACDLLGPEKVIAIKPRMAAEDFAYMAQVAPAAFMLLGVELAGDRRNHHSADFDLDESALYIGTAILAETAYRLMTMEPR